MSGVLPTPSLWRRIRVRHRLGRNVKSNLGRLLSLMLLLVFFSAVSKKFFAVGNLVNIVRQISTNCMLAFGMTFVILTGGIDLSVGSIAAVTSTLTAGMLEKSWPIFPVIALAFLTGFGLGLANGWIVTKMRLPAFIATLATMSICRGVACVYTGGKSIIITNEVFLKIGNGFIGSVSVLIVYLFATFALAALLLYRTRFGRLIFAIGDNRETAGFIGIGVARVESMAYALSGAMAGLVGIILSARMYSGQPLVGDGAELDAVAAVVVGGTSLSGGVGTLGGTFIGALIIGVLNNGLNLLQVQSYWQQICKGVVIILAVSFDVYRSRGGRA